MSLARLYYGFLEYLRQEEPSCRISHIQTTSRIEDYVVKEFVAYVNRVHGDRFFVLPNYGKSKRYDLVLLERPSTGKDKVRALVEAKYLRNRHRLSRSSATDEVRTTLRQLGKEIGPVEIDELFGDQVSLWSRDNAVYGLVVVGAVTPHEVDEGDTCLDASSFIKLVRKIATEEGFRYIDKDGVTLDQVYRDRMVMVLRKAYSASLALSVIKTFGIIEPLG